MSAVTPRAQACGLKFHVQGFAKVAIVIGNAAPEFREVPKRLRESQSIVDLVRVSEARSVAGVYEGICW